MNESSEPTSAADDPTPTPARKPRRRRRRFLRLVIFGIVMVLLVIAGIQAILWSNIPRNLVLSALQKSLGVKVEADAVHAGWWGDTRVENVTMTIPLEDKPFVKTGVIRVKHTSLLALVFFGLELESLDIEKPEVFLRQSPSGGWNVIDLAQGMGGGGSAGGAGGATGGSDWSNLPAISIRDAVVHVVDQQNRTHQIGPVALSGRPSDTSPDLVWDFALDVPRQLHVEGRVASGGDWRHQVKIDVQDVRPLLSPFLPGTPDVRLSARWEGRSADGLAGRLSIDRITVDGRAARGNLQLSTAGGKLSATPENLELLDGDGTVLATAVSGHASYDSGGLKVSELLIRGAGIDALASASFVPATFSGELSATWTAKAAPSAVHHGGTVTASIARAYDGRIEARGTIDSSGQLTSNTARKWAGRVEVSAAGPALNDLSVAVILPDFKLTGPRGTLDLTGMVANLHVSEKLGTRPGGLQQGSSPGLGISLASLRLRDTNRFSASGFFLTSSQHWALKFSGKELPLPKIAHDAVGLEVELAGDADIVQLRSIRVAAGETVVQAKGNYIYKQPEPLLLMVEVNHAPPATAIEAQSVGGKPTTPRLVEGRLASSGSVKGTINPMNLRLEGQVQGVRVKLLQRDLGDVSIKVKGYADPHRLQFWRDPDGPPLQVFAANWELEAIHNLEQDATTVTVGFRDMPLREVGKFLGQSDFSGTASGNWAIYIPTYIDVTHQMRAGGKLEGKNLAIGNYAIDTLEAWTVVENGRAGFAPLIARQGQGVFTANPSVALNHPDTIEINDLRLENWPLALPPSTYLAINASAPRVAVTIGDAPPVSGARPPLAPGLKLASGPISAYSKVKIGDIDAGDVRLNATLDSRKVNITLLTANLFESTVEARGQADLDSPNATMASFMVTDVDPARMSQLIPDLKALSGSFDLRGAIGPISGTEALEPIGVTVALKSRDVWYKLPSQQKEPAKYKNKGIRIGEGFFQAQLRLDEQFQMARAVLTDRSGVIEESQECPPTRTGRLPANTLEVAGGEISFWGRAVRNENDRGVDGLTTLTSHFRIGLRCLDLDQITQALKPDDKPVPGLVGGSLVFYGTSSLIRDAGHGTRPDQYVRVRVVDPIFANAPKWFTATRPATTSGPDEPMLTSLLRAMQGEGQITLRKSDLGNIAPIAFLYNAMRLGQDVRQPTGDGRLDLRFENGDLFIDAFRYFNRGIEVRAAGPIYDLAKMQDASPRLTAYGSVRALKDVELPILRSVVPDLEAIIAAIQQGGVSITVRGTLGKLETKEVLFEELGQSMRELLLGDYKESQKAPAR